MGPPGKKPDLKGGALGQGTRLQRLAGVRGLLREAGPRALLANHFLP